MPFNAATLALYLVVDPDSAVGDVLETTREALEHGATMIQLRWKTATDREIVGLAERLRVLTSDQGAPLVINDRTDIALAVGADGVHLGVDDLPIARARSLGGLGFVIGYSPETDSQIQTATSDGADYLGIGPFATTTTKQDAGTALGAPEFSRRRSLTELPVVAIGGITASNAAEAIAAGAHGVAVVSAILRSAEPGHATAEIAEAIRAQR
jgi:thiamine-phosphate pyrophosphorylase